MHRATWSVHTGVEHVEHCGDHGVGHGEAVANKVTVVGGHLLVEARQPDLEAGQHLLLFGSLGIGVRDSHHRPQRAVAVLEGRKHLVHLDMGRGVMMSAHAIPRVIPWPPPGGRGGTGRQAVVYMR